MRKNVFWFDQMDVSKKGENPPKMDDLGVPLFLETPKLIDFWMNQKHDDIDGVSRGKLEILSTCFLILGALGVSPNGWWLSFFVSLKKSPTIKGDSKNPS